MVSNTGVLPPGKWAPLQAAVDVNWLEPAEPAHHTSPRTQGHVIGTVRTQGTPRDASLTNRHHYKPRFRTNIFAVYVDFRYSSAVVWYGLMLTISGDHPQFSHYKKKHLSIAFATLQLLDFEGWIITFHIDIFV